MTVWHSVILEPQAPHVPDLLGRELRAQRAYEETIPAQEAGWNAPKTPTWDELPTSIKNRWREKPDLRRKAR